MADFYTLVLLALVYTAGLVLFWYGARIWYRPADVMRGKASKASNEGQGEQSRANKHKADSPEWWAHYWAHWPDVS